MPTNHDATRAQLETERAQLRRRIDELTVGGEVELDFDNDFADRGQVAGEKGQNRRVAEVLKHQLGLVDKALAHIEGGTYGVCSVCQRDIAADRLAALPATDRCITHA